MTGGASGLGRATVERLVREGAKVVCCDVNQKHGEELAETSQNITYVQTDVTSESDVTEALRVAKSTYGGLDIVVNCAGVAIGAKVYDKLANKPHSLEEFTRILMVSENSRRN